MANPTKEQIEAWHQEATGGTKTLDLPYFSALAYAAGRRAALLEAAEECDRWSGGAVDAAEQLRRIVEMEDSK